DQPPAFAARCVEADHRRRVNVAQLRERDRRYADREQLRAMRSEDEAIGDAMALGERDDVPPIVLHTHVEMQLHVVRLAGGEAREPLDRGVDPLAWLVAIAVEDDEPG